MIHKILFSLFVSFWILGIGQGYVLQGQETTMVEIKAEFTIRNRLDIPAMMEKAGYKDRGEFLSILEKVTGNYNWDRDVKKGDVFVIPSKLAPIKIIEQEKKVEKIPSGVVRNANEIPIFGPAQTTIIRSEELSELRAELERLRKVEERHKEKHMMSMGYRVGDEYNPYFGSTVERILDRGKVICGTYNDVYGFSIKRDEVWKGFDVDICRAFAVAMFGDKDKIDFVEVDGRTRFEMLFDGTIDILSATTTWTYSRNVKWRIEFLPTTFYDGQGFIVRKNLGVISAKQLVGARVCVQEESTASQNVQDFFELWNIKYIPINLYPDESPEDFYIDGDCDMYGTDRSALASKKATFMYPEEHIILPEIISKEPLGPAVKYGDQKWSDIARWVVYVLFIAEEWEINSQNIDSFKENKDPKIQRFMGERDGEDFPHLGAKLNLSSDWAYQVIKQIGNYKEIYEKNVGPKTDLGLKRGMNKLYTKGGLLYAPPLR